MAAGSTDIARFDEELCRFILSWHRKEERLGRIKVIDFDLVGLDGILTVEPLPSRLDYIEWADALMAKLAGAGLSKSFEHCKLKAHAQTLRALCGENIPLEAYVEATMAFRPTPYPRATISSIAAEVEKSCQEHGVSKEDLVAGQLPEPQVGPAARDIENAFRKELDRLRADFTKQFTVSLDFDVRFEFVEVDAYWNYWIDGTGKDYRLRFNRSDREYGLSEITQFCLHELIGHCGQAHGWYRSSSLSRFARILAVHSCEQVHLEGFAQGLPFLLQNTRNTLVELRALATFLRQLLLNDAYLSLSRGDRIEDVVGAIEDVFPVSDRDLLLKNLSDQVNDPIMRTYMFSYPKGIDLVYAISRQQEKIKRFVLDSIAGPMTASDLQTLTNQ